MKLPAVLSAAQVAFGSALALVPATASGLAAGPSGRPAPDPVVRLLGIRMLAQGAAIGAVARRGRDLPTALRIGAAVDLAHAASMLGAAIWKPQYRRGALASAGTAGISAGAGLLAARGSGR